MVLAIFISAYVVVNLAFALLYVLAGDVIAGAHPGSFTDAFHFSVQTFSTVGYGQMAPRGFGHVLVTLESAVGVLMVALATGLVFAKFSCPTARILFSRNALLREHDGLPNLIFRLANTRGNQVLEASVKCVALKDEVSREGEKLRSLHDLKLRRDNTPLFSLTWTVMHPIDESSPLHGLALDALRRGDVRIIVSFTGLDDILAQQIHASHAYLPEDLLEGRRFVDVLRREEREALVDLSRLDETEPFPAATAPEARQAS
jgi:inward rectifier potassium channel